jgi:hypothetical protein
MHAAIFLLCLFPFCLISTSQTVKRWKWTVFAKSTWNGLKACRLVLLLLHGPSQLPSLRSRRKLAVKAIFKLQSLSSGNLSLLFDVLVCEFSDPTGCDRQALWAPRWFWPFYTGSIVLTSLVYLLFPLPCCRLDASWSLREN